MNLTCFHCRLPENQRNDMYAGNIQVLRMQSPSFQDMHLENDTLPFVPSLYRTHISSLHHCNFLFLLFSERISLAHLVTF